MRRAIVVATILTLLAVIAAWTSRPSTADLKVLAGQLGFLRWLAGGNDSTGQTSPTEAGIT